MAPTIRDAHELSGAPASTGVAGLDEILKGGFPRGEMHLLQGGGGTGKTTLALQFLLAGAKAGEKGLYFTLAQTERGLERIARSHGWSLESIVVHELSPGGVLEHLTAHQTVLHTAEVELDELTAELRRIIEDSKPRRVVFDSIGVIGLLAGSATRYHREIVLLRELFTAHGCTALFIGDWPAEKEPTSGDANTDFHSVSESVTHMDYAAPEYGEVRRRVRIVKLRGVDFHGGYHNFRIRKGGLDVYPRLGAYETVEYSDFQTVPSGIETLDALLGGGLENGTACLLLGPSGSGKSTLASVFGAAAAERGESVAFFLFDERPETFKARARGLGIALDKHIASGKLTLEQLPTGDITPGQFAQHVRDAVDTKGARVVAIDSLTGYFNAMGNSRMLMVQMHELLTFLSRRGVLTILMVSKEGLTSAGGSPPLDVSYLSDTILMLQQYEHDGAIRRCIAAVKKRQGEHETSIRELILKPGRVDVGEPLRGLQRILEGHPTTASGERGERA
jgi:circadian clock protein KaiC